MTYLGKCLPYKHKDLILILRTQVKKPGSVEGTYNYTTERIPGAC